MQKSLIFLHISLPTGCFLTIKRGMNIKNKYYLLWNAPYAPLDLKTGYPGQTDYPPGVFCVTYTGRFKMCINCIKNQYIRHWTSGPTCRF